MSTTKPPAKEPKGPAPAPKTQPPAQTAPTTQTKPQPQPKPAAKPQGEVSTENLMKNIRIEKLVLNISVGESGDKLTKGTIFLIQPQRSWKISLGKSQSSRELGSPSEALVLRETKRSPLTSLSEERRQSRSLREALKSRIKSSERRTSLRLETLDSASKSTSIWE